MSAPAAVSVATFSAVLAEAFSAVSIASLQTNMLIGGLRRARAQARAVASGTTPTPAPAAAPAAGGATTLSTPVSVSTTAAARLGDHEVTVGSAFGGNLFTVNPATVGMLQFFADKIDGVGGGSGFLSRLGVAMQASGSALDDMLGGLASELGVALTAGAPAGGAVDIKPLLARLGAVVQAGQPVSYEASRLVQALATLGADSDDVDVFVAKTAHIHAEFEFQASDEFRFRVGQTSEQGGALGALQIVSLAPGFSALYQSTSRNKITLDVEFGLTNVKL
jgi:hypothetical protein